MSFIVNTGNGGTVEVEEPRRAEFANTLSGAIQFTLANVVYWLLERIGEGAGALFGSALVSFMERVEPSLVHYTRPLIDMLLELEELPDPIREFFTELREPAHEGATAILGGLASQAGGQVMGNVLAPILAPVTYALNTLIRPALTNVTELIAQHRFGLLNRDQLNVALAQHGFKDYAIENLLEITRARLSPPEIIGLFLRGEMDTLTTLERLAQFGYTAEDAERAVRIARPIPGVGDVLRGFWREEYDLPEARRRLETLGFWAEDAALLTRIAAPLPGVADLVRMGVREAWRDDVAEAWGYDEDYPPELGEWLARQGYDPDWAIRYWRAHWALPSIQMGFEMMHRDIISAEELAELLRISDIPAEWRRRLVAMSYTPLTRVDVRRMYGLGVLDEDGVKRSYRDLGYNERDAERMTTFTVLYEEPDTQDKVGKYKEETKRLVLQAYNKRTITHAEAVTRLNELGYPTLETSLLLELATWSRELAATPDYYAEFAKDARSIIERAYSRRVIGATDARAQLESISVSASDSAYLMASIDFWYNQQQNEAAIDAIGESYVSRGINRSNVVSRLGTMGVPGEMQAQLLAAWDQSRWLRSRRLTEAQYRRALGEGILSLPEYAENMRGLGYTEYDTWVLCAMAVGPEHAGPRPTEGPL